LKLSENELGGKIKLTVPQLRVYLSCQERHIAYIENSERSHSEWSLGKIDGIRCATRELLKALNLPEDWARSMDLKEDAEVNT
jgi:hypothetical protein